MTILLIALKQFQTLMQIEIIMRSYRGTWSLVIVLSSILKPSIQEKEIHTVLTAEEHFLPVGLAMMQFLQKDLVKLHPLFPN